MDMHIWFSFFQVTLFAVFLYRLNEVPDGYALRAELAEATGRTSVPAVFICGEFVGGCNDGGLGGVMTLDRDGRLQEMLANIG